MSDPHPDAPSPPAREFLKVPGSSWVRSLGTLFVLLFLAPGCSRPDGASLPEWTAADHDHQDLPANGQVDTSKRREGMPDLERHGVNDVILATWKQNCITCHGVIGRGDGPQGAALSPPDFTNPEWQDGITDAKMTGTITAGQGRMPAFSHLPGETVTGLVNLIRLLGARPENTVGQAEDSGAPEDGKAAVAQPTLPPAHPPISNTKSSPQ